MSKYYSNILINHSLRLRRCRHKMYKGRWQSRNSFPLGGESVSFRYYVYSG